MRNKSLTAIICFVLGLGILLGGCSNKSQPTIAPVEGGKAPEFEGKDLNDKTIALKDLLDDKLVLTFWRINSPPTERELRTLKELQVQYGNDLDILTVNVEDEKSEIQIYLKNKTFDLPVILDGKKTAITNLYRIDYMPTTFVIDEDGVILKKANGGISKAELVKILEK